MSAPTAGRRAACGAVVQALFGEIDVGGRLPVTLPGLYPYGHGVDIPRREMTLAQAEPEEAGFRPDGLAEVDRVIDSFLEEGAFPGGVVAVGHRGSLVHLRPFGRLSEAEDAATVEATTIYDLASLTKVIATTTMAMILVDGASSSSTARWSTFCRISRAKAKTR